MRWFLPIHLKNSLKRVDTLLKINACIKSRATNREYERTMQYYASRSLIGTFYDLLLRQCGDRISRSLSHGNFRLFFLGTDELQDRSGILQALEQFGELTYFTRSDGCYGQNQPGPDRVRRQSNTTRLLELFGHMHSIGNTPDILLGQTWAGFVDPKALAHIRDIYGTIIINIGMDDRHQYWGRKVRGEYWGTYGLINSLDLALTAAPECVDWYMKEGCPALFFPEASDPAIFHPVPDLPKVHDICFVGGRYGIREEIVLALQQAGVSVAVYGSGWQRGRLPTEEVPRLLAQSRIILGIGTIGHCRDFYALKMRDFDGPMSGSLYLTSDNPDLRLVYDVGKEIVTYRTVDDCVKKTLYYLRNDQEREEIASRGHQRAVCDHTWSARFSFLFSELRKVVG